MKVSRRVPIAPVIKVSTDRWREAAHMPGSEVMDAASVPNVQVTQWWPWEEGGVPVPGWGAPSVHECSIPVQDVSTSSKQAGVDVGNLTGGGAGDRVVERGAVIVEGTLHAPQQVQSPFHTPGF